MQLWTQNYAPVPHPIGSASALWNEIQHICSQCYAPGEVLVDFWDNSRCDESIVLSSVLICVRVQDLHWRMALPSYLLQYNIPSYLSPLRSISLCDFLLWAVLVVGLVIRWNSPSVAAIDRVVVVIIKICYVYIIIITSPTTTPILFY